MRLFVQAPHPERTQMKPRLLSLCLCAKPMVALPALMEGSSPAHTTSFSQLHARTSSSAANPMLAAPMVLIPSLVDVAYGSKALS